MFRRRHGKRMVRGEEEEDEDVFAVYSAQSQEDMTANISALSQVIGRDDANRNDSSHGDNMAYSTSFGSDHSQPPPPVVQESPGYVAHDGCFGMDGQNDTAALRHKSA